VFPELIPELTGTVPLPASQRNQQFRHAISWQPNPDGGYIIVVYSEIDEFSVYPVTAIEVPEPNRWIAQTEHWHPNNRPVVDRARKAAEGEDREDLIQQARKAQAQALAESPEQVMAVLKAAREATGISLREFEVSTGISRGNLSRLETGIANPTISSPRNATKHPCIRFEA